jgi:acetyltransferase
VAGQRRPATATLNAAGIPTYPTEADAVDGFMHLVRHHEAQVALMETPPSLPRISRRCGFRARAGGGRAGRRPAWLDPLAVHRLLTAYGIPAAPLALARDPHEAADLARRCWSAVPRWR